MNAEDNCMRYPKWLNNVMSSAEVYEDIKKRIVNLELEPNQVISENSICKEYGVSRSVIRTAFSKLQQIHFIDIYPQRGTYISPMDLNYISDLLMLRTAVEKEVIYEVFTNLAPSTKNKLVAKLSENIAKQEKCRNEKNYKGEFPKYDAEFHDIMINSVNRASLFNIISDDMLHISRWRNFVIPYDITIPKLIDEHRTILEAIRDGDLAKAQKAMANHLETVSAIANRATSEYPEYFKK